MDQLQEDRLTKHQRWLRRKEKKRLDAIVLGRVKSVKRWTIWVLIIGIGGLLSTWWATSQKPVPNNIIARNGLHWHPKLTISIKGRDQEIPTNIGLEVGENPIHTHDASGTIHEEFPGLVTQDDIRLGKFFKAWGKRFSSTCILSECNGSDGQMTMTVNGKSNTDFDQYIMRDNDKIEIEFK